MSLRELPHLRVWHAGCASAEDLTAEDRARLNNDVSAILAEADFTAARCSPSCAARCPDAARTEGTHEMAKILVVDDDPFNLKLALTVLEQGGHEVLTTEGGEAGVAAALAHAPDLVLMDVQMPGVDGLAALQRLRADPRGASLKVVALTALAMTGDAERLLATGFDGYLEKPIRYKEFIASVAALLEGTSRCNAP